MRRKQAKGTGAFQMNDIDPGGGQLSNIPVSEPVLALASNSPIVQI